MFGLRHTQGCDITLGGKSDSFPKLGDDSLTGHMFWEKYLLDWLGSAPGAGWGGAGKAAVAEFKQKLGHGPEGASHISLVIESFGTATGVCSDLSSGIRCEGVKQPHSWGGPSPRTLINLRWSLSWKAL